jgi:hypothetical protein
MTYRGTILTSYSSVPQPATAGGTGLWGNRDEPAAEIGPIATAGTGGRTQLGTDLPWEGWS